MHFFWSESESILFRRHDRRFSSVLGDFADIHSFCDRQWAITTVLFQSYQYVIEDINSCLSNQISLGLSLLK